MLLLPGPTGSFTSDSLALSVKPGSKCAIYINPPSLRVVLSVQHLIAAVQLQLLNAMKTLFC